MTQGTRKYRPASVLIVDEPNPETHVEKGSLAGNSAEPIAGKSPGLPCPLGAAEAASYLLGLDDKPGAALLTASIRDILLRIDVVRAVSGLSTPTIYRLMAKHEFPRPVKLTGSARAWKLSEISAWVESRPRERA